jgi:hypothetical protein
MKVIPVSPHATEINGLLDQARHEEVLLQSADGSEFLLVAVDDFAQEILRTRQNERLMALLDERAQQTQTVPLDEVKRQLGLQK